MMNKSNLFKKYIALPQDHGSWILILSPLVIGIFASERFTQDTAILVLTTMAAFFLRQPLSILVKVISHRRDRLDLQPALIWAVIYGSLSLAGLIVLILRGFSFLLYLAVPGVLVFAWHLWLVSRRQERKQAGVEIIATGVLALAAPAALWVGQGAYLPTGWWLWLLVWLQSAASIVYAYLRLEQRGFSHSEEIVPQSGIFDNDIMGRLLRRLTNAPRNDVIRGRRALLYTTFNVLFAFSFAMAGILPRLIFLPYLLQWAETLWGITHPAIGWKPTRIGLRQLIVSTLWTVLFVITWRL